MGLRRVAKHRNPYFALDWAGASLSAGAEASNARRVTVQLTNQFGANIAHAQPLRVYLSDAATGIGVAASAPSGGVAIGTKGAILAAVVAGKVLDCITDATGALELDVTEATAKTFHVVVPLPQGGTARLALAFA